MKLVATRVRALNSLLFIKDARERDLPIIDRSGPIWSTKSCVAVGCMPDCDGSTEIIVGNSFTELSQSGNLIFDAFLKTPARKVVVETVLGERVLEQNVPNATTHVRIWTNGSLDTDRIVVGLE
jgi:hypothetical protein